MMACYFRLQAAFPWAGFDCLKGLDVAFCKQFVGFMSFLAAFKEMSGNGLFFLAFSLYKTYADSLKASSLQALAGQ